MSVYRAPRDWTRVHPVSPLLGGWAVFGAVVGFWIYARAPEWVGGMDVDELDEIPNAPVLVVVAGLVLAAVVIGVGYIQWNFHQFKVGDDAVYLRKGVIFRQQVQARLARLQAVDTVQPLLARIFGFAKVRIEVAGGEGSALEIAFLRAGDAEALRNEILLLAAGRSAPVAEDADAVAEAAVQVPDDVNSLDSFADTKPRQVATPAAAQREMYAVPLGRLVGSMVLSGGAVALVLFVIGGLTTAAVLFAAQPEAAAGILGGVALGILPGLLGVLSFAWAQLNAGFGFRAGISQDGIRLRHGMLETRRQTVPPGRVQAIAMRQTLLWRSRDWWKVTINVAGYQDQQGVVSTLLPVGSRQDALTALWLVLQDLGDPDPAGTITLAMSGKDDGGGFLASPRRSMVFDLLQWRHRGVKVTGNALIIRRGLLLREVFVVPHERTQSLALTQGPLQRLARLATVQVHSTKGPVMPIAQHLDVDDAIALLDDQAARARESRTRQTPEQWMAAVGLHDG